MTSLFRKPDKFPFEDWLDEPDDGATFNLFNFFAWVNEVDNQRVINDIEIVFEEEEGDFFSWLDYYEANFTPLGAALYRSLKKGEDDGMDKL